MATVREKETGQTETYRAEGIREMMGEKGLKEEEEDYIIAKWAQEDVETFTTC
jgi:hypothetical protein